MRGTGRSFTLIEMLIVIAIISILAAMMSPSLQKALGSARAVACNNNLKQISTAMTLYAGDYAFYPAARPKKPEISYNQQWWYFRVLPYTGQNCTVKNWDDAARVRTTGVFNCPEAAPVDNNNDCHFSLSTFSVLVKGYGFTPAHGSDDQDPADIYGATSDYVKPDSRCTRTPGARYARPGAAKIVFVSELGYTAGFPNVRDPFIRVGGARGYMDQCNDEGSVVDGFKAAFRHNGKKNVLWFDLHVAPIGLGEVNYYLVRDLDYQQ